MRSHKPNKNGSMRLVIEDETHVVYSTDKIIRGKLRKKNKIFIKGEPLYDIEPSVGDSSTVFLKTTDNKLIGLLKNGELEGPTEKVKQRHFLSKLNLIPRESDNEADNVSPNHKVVDGIPNEIDVF